MKLLKFAMLIFFAFSLVNVQAQLDESFGSDVKNDKNRLMRRFPYVDLVSYLGYSDPPMEAEVKDGESFHYLYIWVPMPTRELGIRMMSPTASIQVRNPIMGEGYIDNSSSLDYFDTYITLEKSSITSQNNVSNAKNATWKTLAKNNDSEEMPAQPSGELVNSLLRYNSAPIVKKKKTKTTIEKDSVKLESPKTPKKIKKPKKLEPITAGLYRIGFTTLKMDEIKGTFLIQIGSSSRLNGIVMSRTIEGLLKKFK